ncbi:MAG: 2-C-methyl-D-erythritol 4-phosphate cytidylyltransferase [Casimicrobiaceae bacterium]|nr:2-C-methyl-D-erythritol 4-phosphate cytidylyltransferase [Casimicrobiaceae bacterium]
MAIVPAGGSGQRFGADRPKQYLPLGTGSVLSAAVAALSAAAEIERIYVNVQPEDPWAHEALAAFDPARVRLLRQAGPTRALTVARALAAIAAEVNPDSWVLVHDAARPCLSRAALERLLAARQGVGALLALPLTDTVKRANAAGEVAETLPRDRLWRAQTPQMFRYDLLREALAACPGATDEAQAVESLGFAPRLILGESRNLKITHREDLPLAAFWLTQA